MKVLFQTRSTLFTMPGGDTTQVLKTKEFLEKLGVKVDISLEAEPDLTHYNLVHVFNLMEPQEIYLQVMNAARQKVPVVLSTIYGLYTEFEMKARGGVLGFLNNLIGAQSAEYLKRFIKIILRRKFDKSSRVFITGGYRRLQKKLCNNVSVYLPNSQSEMERVIYDMGLKSPKYIVVPNSVDVEMFNKAQSSDEFEKYKGCVLCAAKIDGRKNQLNLIRAMKDLPYTLVLAGKASKNSMYYLKKCLKEADSNKVVFLGQIAHDKLPALYKQAKVHALISWMETPGLVSLEAAYSGCNIVATKKGDTEDYFGNYATYCEPDDIHSIRNAIETSYNREYDEGFRDKIKASYNWAETAKKTLEGYNIILK